MKAKIITGTGEKELEQKINDFIARPNIKIIDLKYTGAGFALWPVFSVLILYEESI